MKAVRNYVKRSSVSRQRRESAQRQEPVTMDEDRGINAKALFALMLSLEKENVAPNIKLYTFTQNYRVRDGVRAHLLKGATMLHISDAGLSRKVVGYVPGIGELAVESRMLQVKERRHWTVDDVGTYILQPSIVDGRPPPYVVPKHEFGKPYQGTLVMHTPATNFHNLVMGVLELARREKVKPEHYYVYIEEIFKPPSDPGNPYGKLIKVATTDESRHSIRKSNQNSPMASINETLVKFQTCAVFIPTFASGRIQPLTDLKLLATLYFTALAVRHRSNFKFCVASQREKHNEFLELLANDPQASLQEMFTAEARTARTQPNFDMEALSKIIEMEALGGIEDIDNEVTKLFVDWAQEYIEADVAHCQANKAKGTDTTHLMPTSQALADNLSVRGYFNLAKGNVIAARDDLEQALDEGPSSPEVLARALCNLGRVHLWSGDFENASDVTQRALAVMRKGASSKENPHIPLAMAIVAQTYNARSDFRDGKTLAQSAIKEARALVKNQAKNLNELLGISIALICVGEALLAQGRASDALEKFQDAKQLRIEVLGKSHIEVAQAMDYCARAYLALDNPQEALNITRSAIVLAKLYDPSSQHVYIRTLMRTFAAAREAMDDLQGASETLKVTLDLWMVAMLTDEEDDVLHPEVFRTEAQLIRVGANSSGLWNPESLFFRAKQTKLFDEILAAYFRVLGKQMDFLGVGHLDVAETKLSIATLLMTVADFVSAQEYLESARKVFELKRGAAHPKTVMANARLAIVLDEMGDLDTAHEMYRTCLVSFNDSKDNIHEADMLNRVSALLLRQRKFDDALLAATAGLHLYTKSLDSKTELVVGEVLFTIASASQEVGRLTQAARLISESISILMDHLEPKNDKLRLAMLRSAKICMARNKFKQAKDQLLRAMATYSTEDLSSHVLCQDTAQQLAKAYQYLDENNDAVELLRRLCRETKGVNNVPAFRARIALAKVDGAPYKTRTKALQSALQISSTLSENKKRASKRSATPIESKLTKLGSEEAVPVLEKLGAFRLLAECYVERNLGVAGCEVLAQGIEVAEREWKSDGGKSSTVNAYINLLEFLASIMEANMCHSQAISVYEQIVNIKSEAFGDLHASLIPSFVALSSCSLDVGDLRYAMKTLEQAFAALKRLGNNKRKSTSSEALKPAFLPSHDECKAMCFVMQGRVLAKEMRLKDSLQKLKDGLALQKKLYGGSSHQVAQTMFYTGETLAAMGQDETGIAKLRETGAFLVSYRGKWEPWCYESLVQLTTLELNKSNVKQALDWLALFDQAKGYMSPHYCAQQKYLEGVILAQKEEEEAALQCLQVSIELHKQCGSSCNEEVNLLQLQNKIVSKSAALKVLLHAAQENSRSRMSFNYEDNVVSSSDDEGAESKRDSRRSSITKKLLSGSKRLSKSVRNRITST